MIQDEKVPLLTAASIVTSLIAGLRARKDADPELIAILSKGLLSETTNDDVVKTSLSDIINLAQQRATEYNHD